MLRGRDVHATQCMYRTVRRDRIHGFVTIELDALRHFLSLRAAQNRDALQHIFVIRGRQQAVLARGSIFANGSRTPLITIATFYMQFCYVLMPWRV